MKTHMIDEMDKKIIWSEEDNTLHVLESADEREWSRKKSRVEEVGCTGSFGTVKYQHNTSEKVSKTKESWKIKVDNYRYSNRVL